MGRMFRYEMYVLALPRMMEVLMTSWGDIPKRTIPKVELIPNILGIQSPLLTPVRRISRSGRSEGYNEWENV